MTSPAAISALFTTAQDNAHQFTTMDEAFKANRKRFGNRGNVLRSGSHYLVWCIRNGQKEWIAQQ